MMITHVVLLKLKDRRPEAQLRVRDLLASMAGRVPQLESLEVGIDTVRSARSYDVSLISRFETWDDASRYQEHPYHQQTLSQIQPLIESAVVVDYECGDSQGGSSQVG